MPATLTNTGVSWPNRTASGQGSGEATPSVDQQHGHRLRRRWPPSRWSEDNPDGDIVDHSDDEQVPSPNGRDGPVDEGMRTGSPTASHCLLMTCELCRTNPAPRRSGTGAVERGLWSAGSSRPRPPPKRRRPADAREPILPATTTIERLCADARWWTRSAGSKRASPSGSRPGFGAPPAPRLLRKASSTR